MDQLYVAKQVNRALQLMVQTLNLPDTNAMEIADLYEAYEIGKSYPAGHIVKHGVNADGETQLYSVLQEHTSQADWPPEATPSLYKAIGFTAEGVSIWSQPLGSEDAYQLGDEVSYEGDIWVSDISNNVWQPGVYGWHKKEETANEDV